MTIRPLVLLPDPILRQASQPVAQIDAAIKRLAADMVETMHDAPGIGLAAIQIGEPVRMLVIDLAKEGEPASPTWFINPQIVATGEDRSQYEEGCLSIPDYYALVERPAEVTVHYRDIDGHERELSAAGLMATCLQHEIDHLNGVLFIDHISKLKRDMVVKKFRKLAKDRTKESAG
jgi:peptide deformylase